jgi:hypothetical protein
MFWRKRKPADFGDEMEAHLQLELDRLRNDGLSEEDARPAAEKCRLAGAGSAWRSAHVA